MSVGSLVWVPAQAKSSLMFEQGKILAVDEATATVRSEDRVMQIDLLASPPMEANPTVEADMTSLHHIHDAGILNTSEFDATLAIITAAVVAFGMFGPEMIGWAGASLGERVSNRGGESDAASATRSGVGIEELPDV